MTFRLVPLVKKTAPIIGLQRPILLIGRHPDCDVRLDGAKISRRHCCVAMAYDRLLIRDLGSRNGVRINGRLVVEARLERGDEIAIGPILFRLEQLDDIPDAVVKRPAPSAIPVPSTVRPPGSSAPPADLETDLVPLDDF